MEEDPSIDDLNNETFGSLAEPVGIHFRFNALTLEDVEREMMAEKKVVKRNDLMPPNKEEEEFKGLMTKKERELIMKIQLSLLTSDPLYPVDFYFKRWKLKNNVNEKEEEKLIEMLENTKLYTKSNAPSHSVAGALGEVMNLTHSAPKHLLKISHNSNSSAHSDDILLFIEDLYWIVLNVEQLRQDFEQNSGNNMEELNRKYSENVVSLWNIFASPSLSSLPNPKLLSQILTFSKGRSLISRIMRFLPQAQKALLLRSLLLSFHSHPPPQSSTINTLNEYCNIVVYSFIPVIANASLCFLIQLIQSVGNLFSLANSKPGLILLTLLISRAEIIKQQNLEDVFFWTEELFPQIFSTFEHKFLSIFPDYSKASDFDDLYVWQFLSAIIVGAEIEQKKKLIVELREKILLTVTHQGLKGKEKVNLFLNALGLDVSQII
jgi:DNA topoisomerase 2-associated protein PAT1